MISLSLCMIVKNEADVLPRILSPMTDIAGHILIADTGSVDQTKEIACKYGAQVFDFPWCEDFSAARNFLLEKVHTDYWMWLDADDLITPANLTLLSSLKNSLPSDTDIVMMKYITAFHTDQSPAFSYYRERILKTSCNFRWCGKVHEAIILSGKLLYSPIQIEHRKIKISDPDRNLRIYQHMLANAEVLDSRQEFYYGKELFYHKLYREAAAVFLHFLENPEAWLENQLDACLQLCYCYRALGENDKAMNILFKSFQFDVPRAEICYELGNLFLEKSAFISAVYWYQQALNAPYCEQDGGFFIPDCHDFLPLVQLCVCYDKLGQYKTSFDCLQRAAKIHPDEPCIIQNQQYFLQKHGFS